jgi:hypothetical protein
MATWSELDQLLAAEANFLSALAALQRSAAEPRTTRIQSSDAFWNLLTAAHSSFVTIKDDFLKRERDPEARKRVQEYAVRETHWYALNSYLYGPRAV